MNKYRTIRKTDKFPKLPDRIKPKYILRQDNWTYIFGEDKEKRYTFIWDRVSKYYSWIYER